MKLYLRIPARMARKDIKSPIFGSGTQSSMCFTKYKIYQLLSFLFSHDGLLRDALHTNGMPLL